MIRLLDSCIRILAGQGMQGMFIDAIRGGDEGFQSMGKQSTEDLRKRSNHNPLTEIMIKASRNGLGTEKYGKTSRERLGRSRTASFYGQ